jgi:hypothetical protein
MMINNNRQWGERRDRAASESARGRVDQGGRVTAKAIIARGKFNVDMLLVFVQLNHGPSPCLHYHCHPRLRHLSVSSNIDTRGTSSAEVLKTPLSRHFHEHSDGWGEEVSHHAGTFTHTLRDLEFY